MAPPQVADPFTSKVHRDIYPAISPLDALAGSTKGATVVITGAGRGIGRAQAIVFAQAGAKRVVLAARSANELDEVEGAIQKVAGATEVVKVVTDVTDEASVRNLFEKAGDVNVLINNAGILERVTRVHETNPTEWWRTYEVNVRGTFLPTRAALQLALAKPERPVNLTIINTSSVGSAATWPGFSSYQPGKSAINRFTEFVHFEYEEEGVRAFAYHPGSIHTKLAQDGIPLNMHSILTDVPELAAGFSLWLATQGEKVDFLRGRYSVANWDVDELIAKRGEIESKNLLWTRVVGQEQIHQ